MLDYAIVVATRNRLEMLSASLPLLVDQSRPAARIVVVDRSDQHQPVRELCESIARDAAMPIQVVYGDQSNLPRQRNQGLEIVSEDVTIFPDDDVLWYHDTAEEILLVYDADAERRYGAVSGTETSQPPTGSTVERRPPKAGRFVNHALLLALRNRLESRFVPQPFNLYGLEKIDRLVPDHVSPNQGFPLVPTIAGYRMSFRTDVAKDLLFDEVLGSRVGYAQHEDKDMGLRVMAAGYLIAAAPKARVFHNVHPGKRARGYEYGFFQILNYLYISRKVFPDHSAPLDATKRYSRYKTFLYGTRVHNQFFRDVYRGARDAHSEYETIMTATPSQLPELYGILCARHLGPSST